MYMNHSYNSSPTIYGEAAAAMETPAMLAVKFDENGKLALPAAGDFCAGITLASSDAVAIGDRLDVQVKDGCYWMAGAAVKRGDMLAADANGKAQKATDGQNVLAVALNDAEADKPVEVYIMRTVLGGGGSGGGSYAPVSHTHKAADITDGTSTFAEKVHTHTKSDITDLDG